MEARLEIANKQIHVGIVENRVAHVFSQRISLKYNFTEEVSAYWKYSRGFKAGHYNASTTTPKDNPPVDPETINAFETGFAGRWLDGRLNLRGSLFHYDYTNYQVFFFLNEPDSNPVLKIINAESAEVYGAELDMTAQPFSDWLPEPFDGLKLSANFGWLESEFLDFTNRVRRRCTIQCIPASIVPVVVDYKGNSLINSPRFKASGSAEWTFDLGRWGMLIPRYDFQWSDDINFDPTGGRGGLDRDGEFTLPELAIGQKAFFLHNVAVTYRTPEGNIEITAWMRNIFDTVYKAGAFDASQFGELTINFVGQPRTAGIDLSISW